MKCHSAPGILLVSASPQRRDIMRELDLDFDIVTADADEVICAAPEETVRRNSQLKALAALPGCAAGTVIVAADTVVEVNGAVLGKPADAAEAERFLRMLSGGTIQVWSGVTVIRSGDTDGMTGAECAGAKIRNLSAAEIAWYVSTGEPLSRAGAFGISRRGEIFIEELYGSFSCFAGLPKRTLCAMLRECGYPEFAQMPPEAAAGVPAPERFTLPEQ